MSNQLSIFNFNHSPVKLLTENKTPYFNLIDVCEIFGIQNPRRVLSEMLDIKGVRHAYTLAKDNKKRRLAYISEPNLYRIIFRSDKPIALDFQNWVFDEVLPSIRKNGSYTLTINPEQQHLIRKAVEDRVFRTGEHYQFVYKKLYNEFKIPSYKELPASNFDSAMSFLGGLNQIQDNMITVNKTNLICLVHHMKWLANFYREKRLYEVFKMLGSDFGVQTHDHFQDGYFVASNIANQFNE